MILFASFTGLPCPECSEPIMVSGIYFYKKEPQLGATKGEHCKTEIQVYKDPVTGKTRAEMAKKN